MTEKQNVFNPYDALQLLFNVTNNVTANRQTHKEIELAITGLNALVNEYFKNLNKEETPNDGIPKNEGTEQKEPTAEELTEISKKFIQADQNPAGYVVATRKSSVPIDPDKKPRKKKSS